MNRTVEQDYNSEQDELPGSEQIQYLCTKATIYAWSIESELHQLCAWDQTDLLIFLSFRWQYNTLYIPLINNLGIKLPEGKAVPDYGWRK